MTGSQALTVKIGDQVNMPKTLTVIMSNGSTKEVAVIWKPEVIDTSTAGIKEAVGSVVGYNGPIAFKVTVEAIEKGIAHISLCKDSTSSTTKIDFANLTNFYLKDKKSGKAFDVGTTHGTIKMFLR